MQNEGTVSTDDTPQDRGAISVVTEENQPPITTVGSQAEQAVPPQGAPNTDTPAESTQDEKKADGTPPKRRRRSAERKIAALTSKLEAAENAGAARDRKITQLEQQIQAGKSEAPPAPKPKLQDFKNAEEFGKAWSIWEASAVAPAPAPPAEPAPVAAAPPPKAPIPEVEELEDKGVEIYGEEFNEVLHDDTLPLSPTMADYIFDSEKGPELIMWLDENRADAEKIFNYRPGRLAKFLANIEGDLDTPPPAATPAPTTSARKAPTPPPPPPGEPVRGDGPNVDTGLREGLSMDDYAKRRRAAESKHRIM